MYGLGWITKWVSELPTAAAQAIKHDTEIMLLKAEHKDEVAELHKVIATLQAENRDFRTEIETMKEGAKQSHAVVSRLQEELSKAQGNR